MADTPEPEQPDVPSKVGVGIALTTDPQMTSGLLDQFCLALAQATGIEVVPRGVSSYTKLLDQLTNGDVDIVWLPPILALRATADKRAAPIALPIRDGESSYRAVLFAPQGSRYRTLLDLDGARAAWVDMQSAAGYLIIRAHMKEHGVDLERAFTEDLFLGSHDSVAEAVHGGKADVGATFAYFQEGGKPKRAGWGALDMHIIASAGPIPNDMVAARQGLHADLARAVQDALVDEKHTALRDAARALLAAEGFAVTSAEQLEPLGRLLGGLTHASNQPHSMFPPPPKK